MKDLVEALSTTPTLLLDGAMGTMLMASGLQPGQPPEQWNLLHPERVRQVHHAYIQAGSQLIVTNSFNANRFRLTRHRLQDSVGDANLSAARLAREEADSAPDRVFVAGSMGPTGEMFPPFGSLTFESARQAFAEQASALVQGGVDLLWIETMIDLQEIQAAIAGIQSVTDLPVSATMTFEKHGRTMMGTTPAQVLTTVLGEGAIAVGANCGSGPLVVEKVISTMYQENPEAILIAKANAGLPRLEGNDMIYDGTPEVMAEYAKSVQQLGARWIGACCGSTPQHIQAMADSLNQVITPSHK